ncbi:nucleotidyltransferase domain-containing protein [Paenibacillus sp. SC116]|uniref:nucleotidyltransferase family protein n=1 Tax=Paenibacillus sp. SC116 TaxID=2968986 RepID=UPI00215B30F7|nr:nucleotidyltransferase domain-containing protein [Paenibacillus sp. SC116]MCR8843110.1 nucleotidyltransferase domain-containing protein [Paenibacillus sp. SC116]
MKVDDRILKTAQTFSEIIIKEYDVEQILLFGSHVKGTNHLMSDIDIHINVVDDVVWKELSLNVFQIKRLIDTRIDPKVELDGIPGNLLEKIKDSSIVLFRKN